MKPLCSPPLIYEEKGVESACRSGIQACVWGGERDFDGAHQRSNAT
jgi:hypothetical protein